MRALAPTALATMIVVSGCASAGSTTKADPCTASKTSVQKHVDAANAANDDAAKHSGNGNPASPADVMPLQEARDTWRHEARLAGQLIVGNPTCFTAEDRAQAEELLAKYPP